MNHTCPVCGYDRLPDPPADWEICPCCGTEFENDDFDVSQDELRQRWVASGGQWWFDEEPPPAGWDPVAQLRRAGHEEAARQLEAQHAVTPAA
jgi:hypothetical protein